MAVTVPAPSLAHEYRIVYFLAILSKFVFTVCCSSLILDHVLSSDKASSLRHSSPGSGSSLPRENNLWSELGIYFNELRDVMNFDCRMLES